MRLCQRERASCGACCGLYNRSDPSRPAVLAELRRRTAVLARTPRTLAAFRDATRALEAGGPTPLFPSVRVCPLLGFLGQGEDRVGCLAHPLATGGEDLRDCGVYDAATCEGFLCPSFSWLREEEAALAEEATEDWYLYGLVVTDVPFLRAALAAIAEGTGAAIERRHLTEPRFRTALRRLLDLKSQLAPGSEGIFGAFTVGRAHGQPDEAAPAPQGAPGAERGFAASTDLERAGGSGGRERSERPPEGDVEPVPRRIDYAAMGRAASRYDAILTCVGADPRSGNDLDRFEEEVRLRLDACVRAFGRG